MEEGHCEAQCKFAEYSRTDLKSISSPSPEEMILLQHNTVLDRHRVSGKDVLSPASFTKYAVSKMLESCAKLDSSQPSGSAKYVQRIYPFQFGFREKYLITHVLICITESIRQSIDNNEFGGGMFIF